MKSNLRMLRSISLLVLIYLVAVPLGGVARADGIQSAFPQLSRWIQSVESGKPVKADVSVTLHTILPFAEKELLVLNELVEEVQGQFYYHQGADTLHTEAEVYLGNQMAFNFGERESAGGAEAYITGTDDMLLTSEEGSALDVFLGTNGLDTITDPYVAILRYDEMRDALAELLVPLEEYGKAKKQSFSIKNVGKAARSMVYTFPKDEGQLLKDMLVSLADTSGWQEVVSLFRTMTLSGKGTLTAYYTSNDELIGLAYAGELAFGDATPRKITFLWGFSTDTKRDIHTFSLKAPATKGSDNLTITGNQTWNLQSGKEGLTFEWNVTSKISGKTEKDIVSVKLTNARGESTDSLKGDISLTREFQKNTEIWLLQPALLITGGTIDGSVRYTHTYNKKAQQDLTLTIAAKEAVELRLPFGGVVVDVNRLFPNERESMENKVAQSIAYGVLAAALQLPEEKLQFIRSGMDDLDWNQVIQAFTGNQ